MNRSARIAILPVIVLLLAITGCNPQSRPPVSEQNQNNRPPEIELYVLAAASLGDAMEELKPRYESSHPGQKLVISYGASGTLQQQIEQGAPADVFLSAASKQMDELSGKDLIDAQTNLLTNKLVLVVPKDSGTDIKSFEDLQKQAVNKIAVGYPESVPAGVYAKQCLTRLGLWEILQPKIVYAKDVRQVLAYVETGNADAGIVYKTDAEVSGKVKIIAVADGKTHSPILYPAGLVKNTRHPKEARDFYEWLQGAEAIGIFAKYGFDAAVER